LAITTADGWTLVIHHRPAAIRRFVEPVVLCHGLANNGAFFEFDEPVSLAQTLARAGFDCYTVDLRGAGDSRPPHEGPHDATFDDHVRFDVPAIVDAVLEASGARRLLWVGHSLGGLLGIASANGALAGHLAALVTIGSPVFLKLGAATRRLLALAPYLAPWGQVSQSAVVGLAPFADLAHPPPAAVSTNVRNITSSARRLLLANAFAPLWKGVLRQLEHWSKTSTFQSLDGSVDYRANLEAFDAPLLMLAGTVDSLALPELSKSAFELASSKDKQLVIFGTRYGHRVEYGHGDLVLGDDAPLEVYPIIRAFLEAHATERDG
jgi:pimeloyl-ACP methyl ester carboxylesterase